jgi:hypothetical protein
MASFFGSQKEGVLESRMQGKPGQDSVFQEFCRDEDTLRSLKVTEQELEALSRASLLGVLSCKEDILFILQQVRHKLNPAAAAAALAGTDTHKLTEDLRQAALSKLDERDALVARRNGSLWGRIRSVFAGPLAHEDLVER